MRVRNVREVGDAAVQPDLEGAGVGFRRQRARRRRRCFHARQPIGGSGRQPFLDVGLGDDLRAVLGKGFVAAGMVAVKMRVDEIFDRLVRDRGDRGLDLVMQRREFAVYHDDAVLPDGDGDVPALALEHIDVVAEIGGLDVYLGEIGGRGWGGRLLLRAGGAGQQESGCRRYRNPKPEKTSPAPIPDSLAHQRIVCASCGRRASLLEYVSRTKRRALREALIERPASQQGNLTPMPSPIARGVDCDLHPAVPHLTSLLPYLNDYWRDQVTTRGMTDLVSQSYPTKSPISSRPDWRPAQGKPGSSLDDMKAQALDPFGGRFTICNPPYGVQIVVSEDMPDAFCRALNDWLVKEWLDKDARLRGSIMIPVQSVEKSVAEIERCASDKRL